MDMQSIICMLLLVWSSVATLILLTKRANGHRLYGVVNDSAAKVVAEIMADIAGVKQRCRFSLAAPGKSALSTQILLRDDVTVIHTLAPELHESLISTAVSLEVADPMASAVQACNCLQAAGFDSVVWNASSDMVPPNTMVMVRSEAFAGWMLVFRVHEFKLAKFIGSYIHLHRNQK